MVWLTAEDFDLLLIHLIPLNADFYTTFLKCNVTHITDNNYLKRLAVCLVKNIRCASKISVSMKSSNLKMVVDIFIKPDQRFSGTTDFVYVWHYRNVRTAYLSLSVK